MRSILFIALSCACFVGCQKPQVGSSSDSAPSVPWADSSLKHPKHAAFTALLEKYRSKGLPGISLLVSDGRGTWVGATGKADIENDIPFRPGTISKAASITKLFMGCTVMRMMEDSATTQIGFKDLDKPLGNWLSNDIISKIPNGSTITLGQCMKHETGIPDIIDQDKFYLAVLTHCLRQATLLLTPTPTPFW